MKIGFVIRARLKSKRLPFKVIKDLNGKTVLERIIDRAKKIQNISEIILCTSTSPQDKPLIDIAKKNDVYYYNGSEEDVLQRLLDAAKLFSLDYLVETTADNPLFSIYYSNLMVDEIKRNKFDLVKINGLPLGCATYGINVKALETVCRIKNVIDTEIWGPLIDRTDIFDVKTIEAFDNLRKPEYRLTLDYKEDYELFNHLYKELNYNKILSLYDVVDYLEKNIHIRKINMNCKQTCLENKKIEKIEKFYKEKHKEIIKIKEEIYSL